MTLPAGVASDAHVDLHSHSTASDGAFAPAEVVRQAHAAGLAAIALTDHDTVAGVAEAQAAGERLGIRIVPGVELSAVEGDTETHVLGLHLTRSLDTLEARLAELREMRMRRATRIVERLNALGVPVTLDAVLREAAGGAVGRPHVARALVAGGFVPDFRQAFDRYLGNGRVAFVAKDRLTMTDAIAMIHAAGGLAVLAHPASSGTKDRLRALVAKGLDGVEVLHPSHGVDDMQRLDALAENLGLVRSGGSDWHGASDGSRVLGAMRVPAAWLAAQDARLAARASAVA